MVKTPTANYTSIAAPGNSFNARISADTDVFARNDVDALGNGLELHDHSSGKGLSITGTHAGLTSITTSGAVTVGNLLTVTAGGATITAGNVGIGTAVADYASLFISEPLVSASTTHWGVLSRPTGGTGGTAGVWGFEGQPATNASVYTVTSVGALHAANPTKGAGSTITSAYGLLVDNITAGNTNNYGIYVTGAGITIAGGGLSVTGGNTLLANQVNFTGTLLGFFNASANTKQTITGSRGANAALASLLTGLAGYGLITDSTTA